MTPESYDAYKKKRAREAAVDLANIEFVRLTKTPLRAVAGSSPAIFSRIAVPVTVHPESRSAEPATRKDATAVNRVHSVAAAPNTTYQKFRNVKTDGYASKKESQRAFVLKLQQEAGQIRNLREQVKYLLIPKQDGERECSYVADFVYEEFAYNVDHWNEIVEDTKGFRTPDYIIKRKLMLFLHKIRIREV
jgi:hypothetical protein